MVVFVGRVKAALSWDKLQLFSSCMRSRSSVPPVDEPKGIMSLEQSPKSQNICTFSGHLSKDEDTGHRS
jgi:hypothetical protein